jgi:hypothetical protein
MMNLSELKPRLPIFEIGTEGVVGYTGATGVTGSTGISVLSTILDNFAKLAPKTKICSICCGKGKVEKQGLFGVIRLVTCKCRR